MTDRAKTRDRHWLLVVATSGTTSSSTLRVHIWRRLRSAGALYLHTGVALLPDVAKTRRLVEGLAQRATAEGTVLRVLPIAIRGNEQAEVIHQFCAERDDEYRELLDATNAFLAELTIERTKGRTTYTEFEESEAELRRLQTWLTSIRARDYFDALLAGDARTAVDECQVALDNFELDAYSAEAGESASTANGEPGGGERRLNAVEDAS